MITKKEIESVIGKELPETDWQQKIDRARTGSQRWGQFLGVKPSEHTG